MNQFTDILSNDILNKVKENIYVVLKRSMLKFHTNMPASASENGVYTFNPNFYDDWHVGFWAGIYYLAHEMFGDRTFLSYAESITEALQQKTINHTLWESPDEGFIYMPSCVNSFKVNRNYQSIETLCIAADRMVKSNMDLEKDKLHIVRTKAGDITNLNLLRLVGLISSNEKYTRVADAFEKLVLKNNIDSDGRCIEDAYIKDGKITKEEKYTDCGRANAWMLHGIALRYANTQNSDYLDLFHKIITRYVKRFFMDMLKSDGLKCKENSNDDTTSLSILNCAIMELVKKLEPSSELAESYLKILKYNLNYIISEYLISFEKNSQGLIDGGCLLIYPEHKIKGSTIVGDYFFMETLMHLDNGFISCWDIDNFIKYITK